MMNVSPNGVSFIAGWEKYAATPYRDLNGFWTWGYGHLQMPGETRPAFISQPNALALLKNDLGQFVGIANNALKVAVSQNQFDAFISILMNVGPGVPKVKDGIILLKSGTQSTLLKDINARLFPAAALQFLLWDQANGRKVQGLLNRRQAESKLFQQPDTPVLAYNPTT
jgi:lysozyme